MKKKKPTNTIFKELGYKEDIKKYRTLIRFNKDNKKFINFLLREKCVEFYKDENNPDSAIIFNLDELHAIIEKARNLRLDRTRSIWKEKKSTENIFFL